MHALPNLSISRLVHNDHRLGGNDANFMTRIKGATMTFIRVRKAAIKPDTWIQPDGFDICLACWKDYMQIDDRDLGTSRVHLTGGAEDLQHVAYEIDPYAEQRKSDLKIGAATDAMIDSLSRLHIWAIYKAYGIGQVWNFPHADFMMTLEVAKRELELKLRRNLATCVKF
jgi:hypothetical protein